jgi:hypothetical protein
MTMPDGDTDKSEESLIHEHFSYRLSRTFLTVIQERSLERIRARSRTVQKTATKLLNDLEFALASRPSGVASFARRVGAAQIRLEEVYVADAARGCDFEGAFTSGGAHLGRELPKTEECPAETRGALKKVVSCVRGV